MVAHIVVVDDYQEFAELVEEVLGESGYAVSWCGEEKEALTCITSEHPDLVLLDIRLDEPGSGWKVLDQVRANPATAETPVIVCSAAVDALHAREAWLIERGVGTLSKPFDIQDLLQMIEQTLRAVAPTRGRRGSVER